MNLENLRQKLLAAARAQPSADHVPFAFEKRILARLAAPALDHWALWSRALWRAAAPCVALMLGLLAWSLLGTTPEVADAPREAAVAEDFSQHFEQTMLAGVSELEFEDVW